ncbi:unnamed protein product [Debaryomyces tyrocola]|nr:unnamed protein product [Debaryomyces tyrocola]
MLIYNSQKDNISEDNYLIVHVREAFKKKIAIKRNEELHCLFLNFEFAPAIIRSTPEKTSEIKE